MRVAEVMTPNPIVISPEASVERAAELMKARQVGALPVCEGERLVGLLTGRDIAERCVASAGSREGIAVSQVMTCAVRWATTEDDPRAAGLLMADLNVRRLPVMDVDRKLVGIVSLGDLEAADAGETDPEPAREAAMAGH
jgi:CBS domain-containing protein